uniref:Uncharacterized protein n=1 Tax=Kryptolebias marmoratus TaxID=37003 RepID=A0A3Q3AB98_KRYMA
CDAVPLRAETDRLVVRTHGLSTGLSINFNSMVLQSSVGSIILKWKTSGTARTFVATPSNHRRRALVREFIKIPMVPLTEFQRSRVEIQKDKQNCKPLLI